LLLIFGGHPTIILPSSYHLIVEATRIVEAMPAIDDLNPNPWHLRILAIDVGDILSAAVSTKATH